MLAAQPAALDDDLLLHQRNVSRRAAKADRAQLEEKRSDLYHAHHGRADSASSGANDAIASGVANNISSVMMTAEARHHMHTA